MSDLILSFNHVQATAFASQAKETVMCSGLGSGKSFLLGAKSYEWLSGYPKKPGYSDAVFGLFAPTNEQLTFATLRQVQDSWQKMGFLEDSHYVINIRPPAHWGIAPFSKIRSTRVLTTVWGTYMLMSGLDRFDSLRGIEFDGILIDEWRDVDEEAREVIVPRARGKRFTEEDIISQVFYATTPPDNPTQLMDMRDNGGEAVLFVTGSTHINEHNLPKSYIIGLKKIFDERTFNREIMAELSMSTDKPFAYIFKKEKHVSDRHGDELFDPQLPIYLSFDFNVDPQTCLAFQHDKWAEEIRLVAEFRLENADIYEMCDHIKAKYGNYEHVYFYLTGDSTGKSRQGAAKGKKNYYKVIKSKLGIPDERFDTPGKNMAHSDSRVLVNSCLQNFPSIQIGNNCTFTIADLQLVGIDDEFKIDKSNPKMGHLLDCFRYYFHTYHFDFIKYANIRTYDDDNNDD